MIQQNTPPSPRHYLQRLSEASRAPVKLERRQSPQVIELYFDGIRVAVWERGVCVLSKSVPAAYSPLLVELVYDGALVFAAFDGQPTCL